MTQPSKDYQQGVRDVLEALTDYWVAMSGVGDNGDKFKQAYRNLVRDDRFEGFLTQEERLFFERGTENGND